jgi:hypothetical protein
MIPLFEAKYINIKWHDKNSVLKIEEAILPISIEVENEVTCNIELQTYTRIDDKLDGQIAFHILDTENDIEPFFIDADNNNVPLLKIVNPANNKVWWVENGQWNSRYKYRDSPLWNHVGDTQVVFGDLICNINVRANSFSRSQLDLYLNDFKNDFWYLILKKDSITKGEAKEQEVKLLNNDTTNLIYRFIEFIEKVLDNPKKELREIQGVKDIKKVKPVPRTFMEIATSGFQKKLTSRDTIESYNVAENKYIYFMIHKVYNIVFYMLRASGHMEDIFEKKIQHDQKRINNFTNTKTIDKETFENEIIDLKNRVKKEKENLKNSILNQDYTIKEELEEKIRNQNNIFEQIQYAIANQPNIHNQNPPQKFIIRLENRQQNYGNKIQFWGKIRKIESENWDNFQEGNSLSLAFDLRSFNFLMSNLEYEIYAKNIYNVRGNIHEIYFTNIVELKPLNLQQNIEKKLEYKTIIIKTNYSNIYNDKIQFKGQVQLSNGQWFQFNNNNDSFSLEFDKDIFGNVLYEFQEYKITGYMRKSTFEKHNGGKIYKRYFQYIENIEQLTKSSSQQALESLELQRQNLEATNWIRPLNNREQEEQKKEKEALEKATNLLKENQQQNLELLDSLKPTIDRLKKLLNKCKELNIQKDSYFPNSMTFIQNPNYQGSYSFYKKINEVIGVDKNLFIQLQLIEKIGLLDIPTIYERWCYLQIIKVLIDKYRFQPENNWKMKLANQIMGNLNKIKNVKIQFTNELIKREIDLWYEKVLDSGKRPDFILDISSTFGTNRKQKLVMDAKFHEEVDVKEQIELLYKKKNYAENDKNSVFILHPDTNKSIIHKRTPKEWGNDAYYGEVEMFNFEWDKDKKPDHKYGSILLSPISKSGNYLDNLQRLIGMNLQYRLEDNSNIILGNLELNRDVTDPEPREKIFCLVCGSDQFTGSRTLTAHGRGFRYQLTCNECKHFYIYNYCWNCKTRLIKNGEYWTYHSNQVLEPFNIKCPNCNQIFISKNG